MEQSKWIDVNDRLPTKYGIYKVKTPLGEISIPLVHNYGQQLVWVWPTPDTITHWLED